MSETDGYVLGLCQRLLKHSEDLHAENRRLYGKLRWLADEYRQLLARFEQSERAHAAKEQTADILLGAAMDELASGTPGGTP